MTEPVLLIDLSSIFWPAWHSSDKSGDSAFVWTMDAVRQIAAGYRRVAVCCDPGGRNWRHDIYTEYKANREKKDEDRPATFALERLEERLASDGFAIWKVPGQEADDVIASAAQHFSVWGKVFVYTADKDLLQLVSDNVTILKHEKGKAHKVYDEPAVVERFEIKPDQFGSFLALKGDKTDNVPGVPGIGDVKAVDLLQRFGDLVGIAIAANNDISDPEHKEYIQPAIRKAIRENGDKLNLSQKLVALNYSLELPWDEVDKQRTASNANNSEELLGMGEPDETKPIAADLDELEEIGGPPPAEAGGQTPAAETARVETMPKADALTLSAPSSVAWNKELEPRNGAGVKWLANAMFESRQFMGHPNWQSLMMVVLRGRELGLGATTAASIFHNIKGRVCMSAQGMQGLVQDSGRCEYFIMLESDDDHATYETKRKGDPKPVKLTWTIAKAKRAQLLNKPDSNWSKYPDTMLRWRCVAELARCVYPDVVTGIYATEEMEDA